MEEIMMDTHSIDHTRFVFGEIDIGLALSRSFESEESTIL